MSSGRPASAAPAYETKLSSLRPMVQGRRGAVVAGHPAAALIGLDVLRRGGNAFDAGVAVGLAMNVLLGHECSFLGVAPTLLYVAATREVLVLDGVGCWPRGLSPEFVSARGADPQNDILHALPPGAPDSWFTALSRYGTLSFAEVAAPAIDLAGRGFPMFPYLARVLAAQRGQFERWPGTAKIFVPDGAVPRIGSNFVQADLAATLQRVAAVEERARGRGREHALQAARDYVYCGDLARTIVEYCRGQGGLLTLEDIADYRGRCVPAASVEYRGFQVYSTGAYGQGTVMPQALKLLEGYDLKVLGHNSADYIHLVSQALDLAFADREQYVGDPDFVDVPLNALYSEAYARKRRELIDMSHAWREMPPAGDPRRPAAALGNDSRRARDPVNARRSDGRLETGTAYFGVVDADGNIFSCTASDGTRTCPIVPGTGMVLSLRGMQSRPQRGHPAAPAPGKRPRLTPAPALAMYDGRPMMAFGGFGGDKIPQATLQIFLNAVEFGFDPQAAVEAPRVYSFNFPNSANPPIYLPGVLRVERRLSDAVITALVERGHDIELLPEWWEGACLYGLIRRDSISGLLQAGADPRGEAFAMAY